MVLMVSVPVSCLLGPPYSPVRGWFIPSRGWFYICLGGWFPLKVVLVGGQKGALMSALFIVAFLDYLDFYEDGLFLFWVNRFP